MRWESSTQAPVFQGHSFSGRLMPRAVGCSHQDRNCSSHFKQGCDTGEVTGGLGCEEDNVQEAASHQ